MIISQSEVVILQVYTVSIYVCQNIVIKSAKKLLEFEGFVVVLLSFPTGIFHLKRIHIVNHRKFKKGLKETNNDDNDVNVDNFLFGK